MWRPCPTLRRRTARRLAIVTRPVCTAGVAVRWPRRGFTCGAWSRRSAVAGTGCTPPWVCRPQGDGPAAPGLRNSPTCSGRTTLPGSLASIHRRTSLSRVLRRHRRCLGSGRRRSPDLDGGHETAPTRSNWRACPSMMANQTPARLPRSRRSGRKWTGIRRWRPASRGPPCARGRVVVHDQVQLGPVAGVGGWRSPVPRTVSSETVQGMSC